MSLPGLLYVTMQPKPGLSLDQFHDWYNNEHGPIRLRLPQIFSQGLRYRATDGEDPTYLAIYDVTSMEKLLTDTYSSLRANRSPRETEVIAQADVIRYFFDWVHTKEAPRFQSFNKLSGEEAKGIVTTSVEITLKDVEDAGDQYEKWLVEEHIELLAKVPGWLRSRVFRTSTHEKATETTYWALHDYLKDNGQGGPEHKASMATSWRTEVFDKYVASKARRTYSLFYVFGPAPRDLLSLSKISESAAFTSPDKLTSTIPGPSAAINSYITTDDSLVIPYYLEGNPSPEAPTIAFTNSLLTSHEMWQELVDLVLRERSDLRILRFNTRGRHHIPQPPAAATLDTLTEDLRVVLDTLKISKLDALIGVSMGGATTLNFAIKYPDRLRKFVACDFNVNSSDANTQAWKDRIKIAEEDNGKGIRNLAEQTVSRWFHPSTLEQGSVVDRITNMVAANDVEGFKYSCTALWDYDLKQTMGSCAVPGLLVVGEGDGKGALVKAMDGLKGSIGNRGAELKIIPRAGHLPMVEQPRAFWEAIRLFL